MIRELSLGPLNNLYSDLKVFVLVPEETQIVDVDAGMLVEGDKRLQAMSKQHENIPSGCLVVSLQEFIATMPK